MRGRAPKPQSIFLIPKLAGSNASLTITNWFEAFIYVKPLKIMLVTFLKNKGEIPRIVKKKKHNI
jgi:hypothetical protein